MEEFEEKNSFSDELMQEVLYSWVILYKTKRISAAWFYNSFEYRNKIFKQNFFKINKYSIFGYEFKNFPINKLFLANLWTRLLASNQLSLISFKWGTSLIDI